MTKQCLKNYGPVSLLPICGKSLWKLLFNGIFTFFIGKKLISPNHLRFKPCINQLLAITHEICKSFDEGSEVRGVFLNTSKASDKV